MAKENKPLALVGAEETDRVARNVLKWLNGWPELPVDVIRYEFLPANAPSMAMSNIQGAYITQRYILGGYAAEYQFKVIYRIKPGNSMDARLKADETLNRLGAWAEKGKPDLGAGVLVNKVQATSLSALFAQYEGGEEDHQILMKANYEVI